MDEPPESGMPEAGKGQIELLNSDSVYRKLNEYIQDFQNGNMTEVQLAEALAELNLQDEEHFLNDLDEYDKTLRKRLQQIEIAKRALEAANIIVDFADELEIGPGVDKTHAEQIAREVKQKISNIKDYGDAAEVSDALNNTNDYLDTIKDSLNDEGRKALEQIQDDIKQITMGLKVDHLGTTRLGLGTGIVLQGPLGEVLNLGFDKLQVDADNDTAKPISGYITNQRSKLAGAIRSAADQKNQNLPRPG